MEPNRREFQKQCAFQSFCKRVLHNEACNAHDEIRRRRKREVSFCDLALHEERQLYTVDKYFQDEEAEPRYQMAGKEITPKLLLEAIRTLPEEKRTAILLYYFEGMTDVEIGKMFNTSRSTIQYRRTSSFELLKKYLEGHADEWEEWKTIRLPGNRPCSLSRHCGGEQRRPGRYENSLAAFQRLHSEPVHAEALRRARQCLLWR